MSPLRIPARRSLLGVAALAAVTFGQAAPANAAPYEQVSRANGPFGKTSLWGWFNGGTAVGDVGRYAGWERYRYDDTGQAIYEGYVRDIVTNTTITYGGGVRRVYGIDRAERRALILRTRNGQQQVVAVPIAGGAPLVVASFPLDDRQPDAKLSGDGRKVVVSADATGTRLYDLTGGKVKQTAVLGQDLIANFLGARSVSDSANAIVAYDVNTGLGLTLLQPGKAPVSLGWNSNGAVDPAGSVVAYVSNSSELVLRDIARGTERRWALEPARGGYSVPWVGPGGNTIVVTGNPDFEGPQTRSFTPGAPGTSGTWAKFGDRFSDFIYGDTARSPISANGKFALTGQLGGGGMPLVLMQTSGAHIVGANEGLAASAYLSAGSDIGSCSQPATFSAVFISPKFAPAPKKAVVTARVDGQTLFTGTLTSPVRYPPFFGDPEQPGWKLDGQYVPTEHGPVELTASVTDAAGRVLTETWTEPESGPSC